MIDFFVFVKILIFFTLAFATAIFLTPILTHFLYKYRLGKQIRSEKSAPVFASMHKGKSGTPTMGGILIWATTLFLAILFFLLSNLFDGFFSSLNFLTREETYLPLGMMILAALIGLIDDILGVFKIGPHGGGLNMKQRILLYSIVAGIGAWWFYYKLEWDVFYVPFFGDFSVGFWYILIFMFIIIATSFSVNETDGLDGLAGGVLMIAFASYVVVALLLGKYNLAIFCAVISGALAAFLWFNIYPARFFMGDTGAMSLGTTLGVVAMLTNTALFLPFFGFILVLESSSVIIQMLSKKIRKKKIWLSTPIHHHFEAIGWPETKITMRFWILSAMFASVGLILFILDRII